MGFVHSILMIDSYRQTDTRGKCNILIRGRYIYFDDDKNYKQQMYHINDLEDHIQNSFVDCIYIHKASQSILLDQRHRIDKIGTYSNRNLHLRFLGEQYFYGRRKFGAG